MQLLLALLHRPHIQGDGQLLLAAAIARAPDRGGAARVQADCDPDIVFGRTDAVGRIEPDPAQILDPGLGPGVGGVLIVASILMSAGLMMLPPVLVSLPFKIIFFVLIDGWYMLAGSLMEGYLPTGG